jgi:hypothetical protein
MRDGLPGVEAVKHRETIECTPRACAALPVGSEFHVTVRGCLVVVVVVASGPDRVTFEWEEKAS